MLILFINKNYKQCILYTCLSILKYLLKNILWQSHNYLYNRLGNVNIKKIYSFINKLKEV
jgi:hypothetical protein